MSIRFSVDEFSQLKNLLIIYEWGQKVLLTKLQIIQEDFEKFQASNPIEHIKGRIKSPESIAHKLHRLNFEVTADNAKNNLKDIAGIRVICPFSKDIYSLVKILKSMPDIKVILEKDYVGKPKASGYRSYHIITEIPVFYSNKTDCVPVEVQIRTEAMNFWASLEHQARYKYHDDIPQDLCDELILCADKIAELDDRMFSVHEFISYKKQGK